MRIAVVGAGLFGCTVAALAARTGHEVTLIDQASDIMEAATRANQLRLHRGYHYPRSPETVLECRDSMNAFMREYSEAVVGGGRQYYAIAQGSKTPVDSYERFMEDHFLEWKEADMQSGLFNGQGIEAVYRVVENRIDHHKLKSIAMRNLERTGVIVELNTPASFDLRDRYDKIVIAGYAGTNEIAAALGCKPIELQYEIIEKPVVQLPPQYRDIGVVVMDGPFGCIDPGDNGTHLVGHVGLAVRDTWTGFNNRAVPVMPSAFENMRAALSEYLPFVSEAEHIKSHWTVRVVLPKKDATDERPTIVERLDDQVIRILSGKLGHAVTAAQDTLYEFYAKAA